MRVVHMKPYEFNVFFVSQERIFLRQFNIFQQKNERGKIVRLEGGEGVVTTTLPPCHHITSSLSPYHHQLITLSPVTVFINTFCPPRGNDRLSAHMTSLFRRARYIAKHHFVCTCPHHTSHMPILAGITGMDESSSANALSTCITWPNRMIFSQIDGFSSVF